MPSNSSAKYVSQFHTGFVRFLQSGDLSDVTVLGPDKREYQLHIFLLAHHSDFFYKLFSNECKETREKRVELGCDDSQNMWPILVDYFYSGKITLTDDNVQALLSLSRELAVSEVERFCFDFAQQRLGPHNVVPYLEDAIKYNHEELSKECVKILAEQLPKCWFKLPTYLPPCIILQILEHPSAEVQCELQVVRLICRYIEENSDRLDTETKQQLIKQVRIPYLPNDEITELYKLDWLPGDWFMAGVMERLTLVDRHERIATSSIPPRQSYCCIIQQQLPGTSAYAEIPLERVWEDLKVEILKHQGIRVTSHYEGQPEMALSNDKNQYFYAVTTNRQPACVDIVFPASVEVTQLDQYSFSNGLNPLSVVSPYGISDLGYYQMTDWVTEVGQDTNGPFSNLNQVEIQHVSMENVVILEADQQNMPWKVLRLRLSDNSEAGERLSVKDLKLWGLLKIKLIGDKLSQKLIDKLQNKKSSANSSQLPLHQGFGRKSSVTYD